MDFKAVIDTNVLVSALLKSNSTPGKIVVQATEGKIIPCLNEKIVEEYKEVLSRKKFKFNPIIVNTLIAKFIERGIFFNGIEASDDDILPDPKDVVFYEVTLDARQGSDAKLVTGNKKHFPERTFVVSPSEMVEIVEN